MSIPMRARAPVFARAAPRSAVALPGLAGWSPTPLRMRNGVKVLSFLPKLGRLHPGYLIAGILAEVALKELFIRWMLHLNGLVFVRFCGVFPTQFAGFGASLSNCLTGQAASSYSMADAMASVPGLAPGTYMHLLGFSKLIGGVIRRYSSNSIYQVSGVSVAGTRARPFYVPYQRPFVTSVAATYYPPGRVPFDVKPWPVGKYGNPPIGPQPIPEAPTYPPPSVAPTRWTWGQVGVPPRVENPSRTNPITRAPTLPWEREVKIGANTPAAQFFFTLMKAREAVSELQDVIDVIFQSLPKHTQARYGGALASDHQKNLAVFENIEKMDAGLFLQNLLANQIEDEIIGRTWIAGRGKLRNKIFGNMIGSTGPLANEAFKAYAKHVSDLAKGIAQGILGKQGYEYERRIDSLLRSTEKALRDLRRAANQSPPPLGQSRPK